MKAPGADVDTPSAAYTQSERFRGRQLAGAGAKVGVRGAGVLRTVRGARGELAAVAAGVAVAAGAVAGAAVAGAEQ